MDLIGWMGRLIFFLLVLLLALENTATVPLRLTSSIEWQNVPLLVVILGCFVAGVFAGTLALLPRLLRQGRPTAQKSPAPEAAMQQAAELALTSAARQGGAAGDLELETRGRS